MNKVSLIQYAVLSIIGIFYLVYTIRFIIPFREDVVFTRRLKNFSFYHNSAGAFYLDLSTKKFIEVNTGFP